MSYYNGGVWRTADGGSIWAPIGVINISATGVACIDSATAVVVGRDGIYRISSSGATLTRVDDGSRSGFLDVTFISSSSGFAVGSKGLILRTSDAGLTWHESKKGIHADLSDVCFWSESEGAVVGAEASVFYTADSGKSWVGKNAPKAFSQIYFLNARTGFATKSEYENSSDLYASVWQTSDGGLSWNVLFKDSNFWTKFRGIGFFDSLRGCIIGDYYHFAGHFGEVLYFTQDGGKSWQPGRLSPAVAQWGSYPYLASLSIADSVTAYALFSSSGGQQLIGTTDAGQTWGAVGRSGPRGPSVQFLDKMTGTMLVSGGQILRTEDGGLTWRGQVNPSSSALSSVCFSTPTTGVAVGSGGTILSTADGGITWKTEPSPTTTNLTKVTVSPRGNVIAIGIGGVIVRGHIGWPTWLQATDAAMTEGVPILAQSFPNPSRGISTIAFLITQPQVVSLKVYDMLGREVAVLLQERLGKGQFVKQFDAARLPSGMYLLRLQAGGRTATSRLVILR